MMKKMYKHMDDDSEEGVVSTMSEKISVLGNHIYFYTEVTKKTALELIKIIKELAINIMTLEIHNGKDSLYDDDKITYNPIFLHINSGGGCLFSCMSIIDTIKKCKVPVYTIGEGQIASAASIMLLSGKKRFMTENSLFLFMNLEHMFQVLIVILKMTMKIQNFL